MCEPVVNTRGVYDGIVYQCGQIVLPTAIL